MKIHPQTAISIYVREKQLILFNIQVPTTGQCIYLIVFAI